MLGQVCSDLEVYFATPEVNREALQSALAGFKRACDVLRTLSPAGVTVYCREIEVLLQELLAGLLSPPSVYRGSLRHALFALMHFLDALAADNTGNPALCLFPQYQEL